MSSVSMISILMGRTMMMLEEESNSVHHCALQIVVFRDEVYKSWRSYGT